MGKVTCDMATSIDGYVAGVNQSADEPFGEGVGQRLHRWMFEQPEANADELAEITSAGAYIMGRNMFGPGRGEWDLDWNGWWGPEPPYHAPVFVLTHFPREPLEMEGGTTFRGCRQLRPDPARSPGHRAGDARAVHDSSLIAEAASYVTAS